MIRHLAIVIAALTLCAAAQAQTYPNKPIHLIVPAPTGGTTDLVSRITADWIGRALDQRVLVENKGGAGGNIGVDAAAKAAPDGYTLVMVNVGNITTNPHLYKDMPFDALNDLVAVAPIGDGGHVISVHNGVPAKDLRELIAYAKANPGKLNYGSAGNGSMPHLAGVLFARTVGIDIVHIPYRGTGPALADLSTGQIQMGFIAYGSQIAQVKSGAVRVLSVSRKTRIKALPEAPTTLEAGVPGFEPVNWFGVMAPRGTPQPVIALLNKHINAMLDDPEVEKRLDDAGLEPIKETPEQLTARIKKDYDMWGEVIRSANIRLE